MSAEAVVNSGDIQRGYTPDQLEAALHSPEWYLARPNRPTDQDYRHRDLAEGGVERIVDAMLDPAITAPVAGGRQRQDLWAAAPETIDVGGPMGTLEKIGFGESSICYKYTGGGRDMAVRFGAYDSNIGLQIPADPRLTLVNDNGNRRLWSYSDARTYLVLPISRYTAVTLQEFGGTAQPPSSFAAGIGRAMARANAQGRLQHIDNTRPDLTTIEMAKRRHFLYKRGYGIPGIIDIPVEERVR